MTKGRARAGGNEIYMYILKKKSSSRYLFNFTVEPFWQKAIIIIHIFLFFIFFLLYMISLPGNPPPHRKTRFIPTRPAFFLYIYKRTYCKSETQSAAAPFPNENDIKTLYYNNIYRRIKIQFRIYCRESQPCVSQAF